MDDVDPAFRDLLMHPRAQIRAPDPSTPVARTREALDAPLRALRGVSVFAVSDLVCESGGHQVPLRIYRARAIGEPAPVIMFFHGGGFVSGSRDTHDAMCRALCRAAHCDIVSVEYRLAPEHPYPAALEDCEATLRWLAFHGEENALALGRLALCGDSAGGYLALSTAVRMRDRADGPPIRHIGLLYPVVDPSCATPSMAALADGYLLTREAMQWFWKAFAGPIDPETAQLSLLSMDLSGLPPVSLVTAEFDPLRDEGAMLARKLAQAGVHVTSRCYPGMIHGFASLSNLTPFADAAIRGLALEIAESLEWEVARSGGSEP